MGLFDSFYDAQGNEWQTKAFACLLDCYNIGDAVPSPPIDYQVSVLGGEHGHSEFACATIRDGHLAAVPDKRNENLPLLEHGGVWIAGRKSGNSCHERRH